ncbi:MAG: hypothetical protein QOH03_4703 [Kribbellaceae bacterium]|jgi:hypothetical protein|nr:hypothetical protein [Kribbellaceae bacterium]
MLAIVNHLTARKHDDQRPNLLGTSRLVRLAETLVNLTLLIPPPSPRSPLLGLLGMPPMPMLTGHIPSTSMLRLTSPQPHTNRIATELGRSPSTTILAAGVHSSPCPPSTTPTFSGKLPHNEPWLLPALPEHPIQSIAPRRNGHGGGGAQRRIRCS